MNEKRLAKLTGAEEDAWREVGHIGVQHAATALSKIIRQMVNVKMQAAKIASLEELPNLVEDRETVVSGIYLPVTGDAVGSLLMVFPEKSAFALVDLLLKKELGSTKKLSEMDKSALMETGNILAGSCVTALSRILGMTLVEDVPDFAHDMVGALIDNMAVALGQEMERALIIQAELKSEAETRVVGYFFLLFALKEGRALLRTMRAQVGE